MKKPAFSNIRFKTPAKINTFLYIQRIRSDGYHDLLMDLIPISFYDEIEITETATGGIELNSNQKELENEANLVIKAVRLLEKETNQQFSLKIKLEKSIPSGAGIGGGSGNAAGMLSVINQMYELGFDQVKLQEFALRLGADVPFFITPSPSIAEGIGEKLSALPYFKPLNLLLIHPNVSISTQTAYANCHISGRDKAPAGYTLEDFKQRTVEMNDFWISLKEEYPEIKMAKNALEKEGAVFCGLSGSGSTVFGVFEDESACKKAHHALSPFRPWKLTKCQSLTSHRYIQGV